MVDHVGSVKRAKCAKFTSDNISEPALPANECDHDELLRFRAI